MEQDEILFIEAINRQEPKAYQTLYRLYYRALVNYAMRFISKQDEAEDVVQDLFVSMWNKKIQFVSYVSFRTYLYNAVYNAVLNVIKHQEVEQRYVDLVKNEDELQFPEADYQKEEIYRQLYLAIDRLPKKCREIFLMYMDGKKNEEIAQILSISIETVKTQKKRAMRFLKDDTGIKMTYSEMLALLLLLFK